MDIASFRSDNLRGYKPLQSLDGLVARPLSWP
jgi:hypothetical protein